MILLTLLATSAGFIAALTTTSTNVGIVHLTASQFLSTLGVCIHLDQGDSYSHTQNVINDLNYIGFKYVRSNPSVGNAQDIALVNNGIKFNAMPFVGGSITTPDVSGAIADLAAFQLAHPDSIVAVEGPNEINNQPITYNGTGGLAGAVALQKAIYAAVHSNAALSGVSVVYFTGYQNVPGGPGPDPATTPGLADYNNAHPYPSNGGPPAYYVNPSNYWNALGNQSTPSGQAVYTEVGYSIIGGNNSNGGWVQVNANVQAKYELNMVMDAAKAGISHIYLYQLMDESFDTGFGLFNLNNQPSKAATAFHNLTTILADTGASAASFTPTALNYSLSGLPSTGNSLLIQKSTGVNDIVVWAEPNIWNASTSSEVTVTPTSTTVSLGATYSSVEVYDPLQSSSPITTLNNVSSVTLSLTDHPLIVQVASSRSR